VEATHWAARRAREERTALPVIGRDGEQALTVLVHSEDSGVPVLSADRRTVVGWLTHQDVLRAYHERLKPTSVASTQGDEFP
jgi:Mg2+/Co2+ transporter CorC